MGHLLFKNCVLAENFGAKLQAARKEIILSTSADVVGQLWLPGLSVAVQEYTDPLAFARIKELFWGLFAQYALGMQQEGQVQIFEPPNYLLP